MIFVLVKFEPHTLVNGKWLEVYCLKFSLTYLLKLALCFFSFFRFAADFHGFYMIFYNQWN